MEEKIIDFEIPSYIADEIAEYVEDCKNGNCKYMKLENIKALIGLAVLNNRITKEQGDIIRKKYCNYK